MQKYLEDAGVDFQFNTEVTNVVFKFENGKKIASLIECKVNGKENGIMLTENDLVFVTNGSCTEGTIYGDQNHAPNGDAEVRTSGVWSLWKNIGARTRPSDIRRNSAQMWPRQTGSPQLSQHWMIRLFLILPTSANVIREQAMSLQEASSAVRIPVGF